MAARLRGVEYSLTASTPVKLTTILGLAQQDYISTLVMRAGEGNQGRIFWGNSTVTTTANRWGFLKPEDAIGIDVVQKYIGSDEMWLVATVTGDVIHISWVQ